MTKTRSKKITKESPKMTVISPNTRNLLLLAVSIILGALVLLFNTLGPQGIVPATGMSSPLDASFKNLNLRSTALPVPSFNGGDVAPGVSVSTKNVEIMGTNIFYRIAEPGDGSTSSGQVLFLLHGAAFSSKTWQFEIGTIQTMASLGHRVIAVDLPGYGQSGQFRGDRGEFLEKLIKTLTPIKPVLVSPSMSGSFSLPLLDRNQDLLCGFVPVAPVATSSYDQSFYDSIFVPTLIVYGDKDTGLGVTSAKHLETIKTSTAPQVLVNSRHPAYLDQPEVFHTLIYNFMLHLRC